MRRDRDHGLAERNGHASRAIDACEVGLKCRCHSELTCVWTAGSLHDTALVRVRVDLQLRKRTIDSVPDGCVLKRDQSIWHAARARTLQRRICKRADEIRA